MEHGELLVLLDLLPKLRAPVPPGVQLCNLRLDSTGIDCRGAATLARSLPAAVPCLARLSLAGCEVGDAGAQALAAAIERGGLPQLHDLDLDENPLGGLGRSVLRRASRTCGVALSAASVIENESLFE